MCTHRAYLLHSQLAEIFAKWCGAPWSYEICLWLTNYNWAQFACWQLHKIHVQKNVEKKLWFTFLTNRNLNIHRVGIIFVYSAFKMVIFNNSTYLSVFLTFSNSMHTGHIQLWPDFDPQPSAQSKWNDRAQFWHCSVVFLSQHFQQNWSCAWNAISN